MKCPKCGAPFEPGDMFCSECGAPRPAEPQPPTCPECGHPFTPDMRFCEECGYLLTPEATTDAGVGNGPAVRLAPAAPAASAMTVTADVSTPSRPVEPTPINVEVPFGQRHDVLPRDPYAVPISDSSQTPTPRQSTPNVNDGSTQFMPPVPYPASGSNGSTTVPPIAGAPVDPSGATAAPIPASQKRRTGLIIGIVAAVVAVVLCVVGGLVVYKTEMIGPRTVPQVQTKQAANVVKQLEDKGFVVKRKQVYSALDKGGFVSMDGAKEGEKLDKGSTITVVESLGPGVPKGTVGSDPKTAETSLKKMGVKVTEHEVVSDDPGKVSVTVPADGMPVTNTSNGIHIGVGVSGKGIPIEIAGMDKDQAKSELESKGFNVTLVPRFSSKQYLGKIARSDPSIGVMTDATNVTLYYGVDASKKMDVVGGEPINSFDGNYTPADNTQSMEGEYCTDGGDCITLQNKLDNQGPNGLVIKGEEPSDAWDRLSFCPYAQDALGCVPKQMSNSSDYLMKDYLVTGDTGALELFSGFTLPNCGTTPFVGDAYNVCDNGKNTYSDNVSSIDSAKYLRYLPKEFFVVMPVGAKLDQLESSGYFAGKSEYQPDKDRPYLIRRDNSKYQPISYKEPAIGEYHVNPYAPGPGRTAFKDAPNAKNVYYLVENPVDFSQFKEITISGPDTSSSGANDSKADEQPSTEAKDYANARFGYVANIPAGYVWGKESGNGDGRTFTNTTDGIQIKVWGSDNTSGNSPQQELDSLKASVSDEVTNPAFQLVAGQSIYLSYAKDGYIYYQREIVRDDKIAAIQLKYPTSNRSAGDPLTETVPKSLKFVD